MDIDQTIKENFEKFFQGLVDNDLVKVTNDIEQTKERTWFIYYPLVQDLLKSNTDLHQFLQKVMVLLNIDQSLKTNLNDIFGRIISELELLKYRFAIQQSVIDNHEKKINALETDIKLQKAKMIAFDVIKLFRFYYINDLLKGSPFSTWQKFTGKFISILRKFFF